MNDRTPAEDHDQDLAAAGERLHADVAATAVPPPTVAELGGHHRRRTRRRVARTAAVAASVLAVVGAGAFVTRDDVPDSSELAATEASTSTTGPAAPPSIDLGRPVDCGPAVRVGFGLTPELTEGTVRRTQDELFVTQQQVAAYAETQADTVITGFDNDSSGALVVAVFADRSDLAGHLERLRSQVERPESVVVRGAPSTLSEMSAVQAALHGDSSLPDGALLSTGPQWDGLHLQMRADQLPLAERLAREHRAMMKFVIGAKRYEGDAEGHLRRCIGDPAPTVPPLPTGESLQRTGPAEPGRIYSEGAGYPGSAPAGADVGVEYELRSDRSFTWTPAATGPVDGVVVRAGTNEVVGAVEARARTAAMPAPVTSTPGESIMVTVVASTGSADDGDDPALPPGDYEILASIELDGEQYVLPRVPVTLAPASEFAPDFCAMPRC